MEPCKIRSTPQRLVPPTGARRQGNTFSFQQREKNVLAISSYRSALLAPDLEIHTDPDQECEDDFTTLIGAAKSLVKCVFSIHAA